MEVREIDVGDDEQLGAFWSAGKEGDEFERPYAEFWPLEAAKVAFRIESNAMEHHPIAAIDNGEVLGTNQVILPRLDNTHVAFMTPITRPAFRRRGVGSALLDAGLDYVRSRGRSTVIIETHRPVGRAGPEDSPGFAMLDKRGFSEASRELHRVLELPLAADVLDRLAAEAAPHHADYRLVPIRGEVPDELMTGFCALQEAFNSEAPLGDLDLEPEVWNAERVRGNEDRMRKSGRRLRAMAAVDDSDEMVALTEMLAAEQQPEVGWQSGTLVVKEHRGHRLGLAIKVANLRSFQAEFPACRVIHSWNAEENGPMVAINDRLGFRPVEYLSEMQLRL